MDNVFSYKKKVYRVTPFHYHGKKNQIMNAENLAKLPADQAEKVMNEILALPGQSVIVEMSAEEAKAYADAEEAKAKKSTENAARVKAAKTKGE